MSRTVSAAVTWRDTYLGVIGPFPVSVPWWAEAEPVVAHLREVLGVPVLVLRLLLVEGGEGARDGHLTYHVAALDRPAPGLLAERPPIHHAAHVVLNEPGGTAFAMGPVWLKTTPRFAADEASVIAAFARTDPTLSGGSPAAGR